MTGKYLMPKVIVFANNLIMRRNHLPFSLEQLLILRAVAVDKSFKDAAQTLSITQPAVSMQMQNLEKQLQIRLFDREKKQIEFTEAGTLLVRYSNRILNLCNESTRALDDLNYFQSGKLIVGASQTTGTYLMPKVIGLFRQRYPTIEIQLQVASTRKIVWDTINRHIDIGIVGGEIPYELKKIVDVMPYVEDELALILPRSHPFATLSHITKEDLYNLKFITLTSDSTIRSVIDSVLVKNKIDISRLTIEMELNSIESIKNAVQSGLGAAFVSVSAIRKELELGLLVWVKIDNVKITRVLSLILDPNRYNSKASQNFNNEILTLFLKTL
jgi:DNA-binding transcriptional LysR family regulator